MNEYEIVRSYKNAIHPTHQITILTQLFNCNRYTIISILRKHGIIVKNQNAAGRKSAMQGHETAIRKMCEAGMSDVQIAQRYGVNHTAVAHFRWKWGIHR